MSIRDDLASIVHASGLRCYDERDEALVNNLTAYVTGMMDGVAISTGTNQMLASYKCRECGERHYIDPLNPRKPRKCPRS